MPTEATEATEAYALCQIVPYVTEKGYMRWLGANFYVLRALMFEL
jgi:hypothetical protein